MQGKTARREQPVHHLAIAREGLHVPHDDHEGYVEAHVRRLEALRRSGIVERVDADHWRIPHDFETRAAAYDTKRNRQVAVRVLSTFDLEAQVKSDGATWLDRQLVGQNTAQITRLGFGLEVTEALERRQAALISQGHAQRVANGPVHYRRDLLSTLERQEVMRVGKNLSEQSRIPFRTVHDGERVRGIFKETVQLASGKYALVQSEFEFALVPWRPVIDKQLGKEISGIVRGNSISWDFWRKHGIGL